jgi:hypothetical protein
MSLTVPDLSRLVETYLRIGPPPADSRLWVVYVDLLRFRVAPLVGSLRKEQLIGWYSFLVHDRSSGVPTEEADQDLFVHLCLELLGSTSFKQLHDALPKECLFTRVHGPIDAQTISPADAGSFMQPELPRAWSLIGATSEWTLDFLVSHRGDRPIPTQNVAQFLHYLGNQLMVGAICIKEGKT